jgi:hypothetical protein
MSSQFRDGIEGVGHVGSADLVLAHVGAAQVGELKVGARSMLVQ